MREREQMPLIVRALAYCIAALGIWVAPQSGWGEIGLALVVTGAILPLLVGRRTTEARSLPPQVETIQVVVPQRYIRLLRRRLLVLVVGLGAVSGITVIPAFLYQLGQTGASLWDWRVLVCSATTFLFPLVYLALGARVIEAANRQGQ